MIPDQLILKLSSLKKPNNELDVLCEITLFEPDHKHKSIRSNSAGTKVIYTDWDNKEQTFWAFEWTTNIPLVISMIERKIMQ